MRMQAALPSLFGSLLFLALVSVASGVECDARVVKNRKPANMTAAFAKYGLWPGLINEEDLTSGEAMEVIWKNQNPEDCTKAKYLVSPGWYQGFGSEVHYHGVMLGIALDLGRVLVLEGGWTWRYRNEHCKKQGLNSMDCYMVPLSKCTLHDAMATMSPHHKSHHKKDHRHESHGGGKLEPNDHHPDDKTHLISNPITTWTDEEDRAILDGVQAHGKKGHWSIIAMSTPQKTDIQCFERWRTVIEPRIKSRRSNPEYIQKLLNEDDPTIVDYFTHHQVVPINRAVEIEPLVEGQPIQLRLKHKDTIDDFVVMIDSELISLKIHKYTPRALQHLWGCAGLQKGNEYMWWRAISATYYLRPNKETLALMETYRDPVVAKANGQCVSVYVRHGDKVVREMKFVPWDRYANAALTIFKDGKDVSTKSGKVMFLASEDPKVIADSALFGTRNNIDVRVTDINRKILADKRQAVKPHELEKNLSPNREYEYLSYLVHLGDNVKCAANICTIPSNYCRLIDELRGTVGGKANKLVVDLSEETCKSPPCFRYAGFANDVGPLYDPKTRIW